MVVILGRLVFLTGRHFLLLLSVWERGHDQGFFVCARLNGEGSVRYSGESLGQIEPKVVSLSLSPVIWFHVRRLVTYLAVLDTSTQVRNVCISFSLNSMSLSKP